MSDAKTTTVTVGPSFFTLLTILFIALKLTHVISWSWFLVLAPLWLFPAVCAVGAVVFGIAYGIAQLVYVAKTTPEERARDKALAKVQKTLKRMEK